MAKNNLISRFLRAVTPPDGDYTSQQLADKWAEITGSSASGIHVNATTAMKFSAFWACVRILSELPASLQKQVIRIGPDGSLKEDKSHYLYKLIEQPNNLMDAFTCEEVMNQDLQINGNALALIITDKNGYPFEKIPIPWKNVIEVKVFNRKLYYTIKYPELNIDGTYPSDQVLHYKILSQNGFVGRGVLKHAEESIGLGLAAEAFGNQYFQKGGNIKGVIEAEGEFKSKGEYDTWLTSFAKRWQGAKNNFDVPLLERGMKYKQLGIPPEQAQFLQTRQFQLPDVARFFLMPPHMIGDLIKSSFSSIEQQDIQFVKYTLRSLVKKQEKEIEWKLITAKERGNIHFKHNLDSLLRGDMKTRAEFNHKMIIDGVFTRNEVRVSENKNPLPGLDEPLTPAHIVGKEQANKTLDKLEDKE